MNGNDAWSAVSELAASQHGCFTRRQAADHDLSHRDIGGLTEAGILTEPHRGVLRFRGVPPAWRSDLAAATLSGPGSFASHRSAARLHGLDGFSHESVVELTVERGRFPRTETAIVHRWSGPEPEDYTVVDGIRASGVATTLAQLGAVATRQRVEQALDDALRRGYPLAWIAETVERLHRPGPTGTGTLLRLLADPARSGAIADSVFERLTSRLLAEAGLLPPVLQHPVRLLNGRTARIDLAWPEARWGIECHSRTFHFGREAVERDHDRDHQLAMVGWQVSYLTWQQLHLPEYAIDLARRMLGRLRDNASAA